MKKGLKTAINIAVDGLCLFWWKTLVLVLVLKTVSMLDVDTQSERVC